MKKILIVLILFAIIQVLLINLLFYTAPRPNCAELSNQLSFLVMSVVFEAVVLTGFFFVVAIFLIKVKMKTTLFGIGVFCLVSLGYFIYKYFMYAELCV